LNNPNKKLEPLDCSHDAQLYIFECDVKEDSSHMESESDRKIRRVLVCTVASAFTLRYSTWIQKICRTKHGQLHQLNQKLVLFCAEDIHCNLDIAKCNDAKNLYKLDIEASEDEWKGRLALGTGTKRAKTTLLHRSQSTLHSQQIQLPSLARAQSPSSDNNNRDSEDLVGQGTYGCTIYMHDRAEPASTDIHTDAMHNWMQEAFSNCTLQCKIDGEFVDIQGESFEESASDEKPQNGWFSRNNTKQHPAGKSEDSSCMNNTVEAGAEPEALAEAATEATEKAAARAMAKATTEIEVAEGAVAEENEFHTIPHSLLSGSRE